MAETDTILDRHAYLYLDYPTQYWYNLLVSRANGHVRGDNILALSYEAGPKVQKEVQKTMAQLKGKYETVMVFSVKNGEESVTALADKFQKLIADNSTVLKTDVWGQRALAYPINDETAGYYILVVFESDPSFPAELDRVYKITDGVLRTLIVTKGEDYVPFVPKKTEEPAQEAAPAAEATAVPVATATVEPVAEVKAEAEV